MSVYSELEEFIAKNGPVSVRTLYKNFAWTQSTVRMALSNMHVHKHRIYIKEWRREVEGMKPRMLPLFAVGQLPDAPRPPKPKKYAKVSEHKLPKPKPPKIPRVRSVFDLGVAASEQPRGSARA